MAGWFKLLTNFMHKSVLGDGSYFKVGEARITIFYSHEKLFFTETYNLISEISKNGWKII